MLEGKHIFRGCQEFVYQPPVANRMALVFVQWLKCFAATNPGKRRPVLRSQELTDPPPGTSVFSLGNETSKLGHAKTHAPPVFLLFAHVKKPRVHLGGCSAKGAVVGGAGRLGPSCGSSPSKQRLECQPNTPPPDRKRMSNSSGWVYGPQEPTAKET